MLRVPTTEDPMNKNTIAAIVAVAMLLLVIASPAIYTLATGDFPGSSRFYGLPEDHEIVNQILAIRHNFVGVAK
jgi:hypothetical protein